MGLCHLLLLNLRWSGVPAGIQVLYIYLDSSGGSVVKNPPANQETQVWSLGREDPLEKEMVTHSSILVWEIPWSEEPGGAAVCEVAKRWHDLATKQQQLYLLHVVNRELEGTR